MSETVTRVLKIVNEKGLHARASARFVEVTEQHDARVTVAKDGLDATGNSIMGLLMLAAAKGSSIEITCTGAEAQEVADALEALVADKFGEEF